MINPYIESENLKAWREQVNEWEQRYGVKVNTMHSPQPSAPKSFNLAQYKRFFICKKCGGKAHSRHHKGHEFLFACIKPDVYAVRYLEFREHDVVWLCDKCHPKIHQLYTFILDEIYAYLIKEAPTLDVVKLEQFRVRLVKKCESWLKRKLQKPRK